MEAFIQILSNTFGCLASIQSTQFSPKFLIPKSQAALISSTVLVLLTATSLTRSSLFAKVLACSIWPRIVMIFFCIDDFYPYIIISGQFLCREQANTQNQTSNKAMIFILFVLAKYLQYFPLMSSKYIKISEVQESGGFSSGEKYYRSKCYQYEEDIKILQQKLMQTHSKLMDQIDTSRQLQEQINQLIQQQLTKENINSNHSSHSKPNKRSEEMIEKEQLKNDLQVMRNKVLGEIYKNNKLKQNQKQILAKHSEQVAIYKEKNKQLQNLLCDYEQEVEELKQANEKLKQKALKKKKQIQDQKPQCSCGYEKKYYELDRAFMNQRSLTNELIEENNSLQNQLHEQKIKLTVLSKNQEKCVHNAYKKQKSNKKIKRHNFQSTKNLIKQLEEEEREIRSKILQ